MIYHMMKTAWPSIDRALTIATRQIVFPIGGRLFGNGIGRRVAFLKKAQWWNAEDIRRYQEGCLRELFVTAYTEVPLYRKLFDERRLKPEDTDSFTSLRELPVIGKSQLRDGYPAEVTRSTGHRTYETFTSGSTGSNFRVQEDMATAGWYRAAFMLALDWSGWRVGDQHLQFGMNVQRDIQRRLKDLFLRCHYVSAADLCDAKLERYLNVIEKQNIRFVWGYPGSIYMLAKRAEELRWNRPLESVVTWGDMLHEHYREAIERAFRTKVYDTYGCGEGFHIAAQCGCSKAYHLQDFDVIAEFLDEANQPVPPGVPGSVVITRLYAGPMPFIRYRTGDLAVLGESAPCPCGRQMRSIASIQGRDADIIVTPEGNRLIVHFFTGILEEFEDIRDYQIIQTAQEDLLLRIVPSESYCEESSQRIMTVLKQKGTGSMRISVEIVDEIPVEATGKRRFVISKTRGFNRYSSH